MIIRKLAGASVQLHALQMGSASVNSLFLNVTVVVWVTVLQLVNLRLKICMVDILIQSNQVLILSFSNNEITILGFYWVPCILSNPRVMGE